MASVEHSKGVRAAMRPYYEDDAVISREHYHARLEGHCERAYRGLQAALKELNPALSPPEPAKVDCAHITKPYANDPWWTYCPRCGVRLSEA